jgi:hypothetical protein
MKATLTELFKMELGGHKVNSTSLKLLPGNVNFWSASPFDYGHLE